MVVDVMRTWKTTVYDKLIVARFHPRRIPLSEIAIS